MQKSKIKEGQELRDLGIKKALDNANKVFDWAELAYKFLLIYTKSNKEFMAEEVRAASIGIVPEPPSNRAWGGVFVHASKSKLIKRIGYKQVTNPKAHRTPATLWEVI